MPEGFWENDGDELTIKIGDPDYTEDGPPRRFIEIDLMSGHCCARLTSDQARQAALVLLVAAKKLNGDAMGVVSRFEYRDGVPYYVGPAPTAAEAMDPNRPLPRLALYALGWTDAEIDATDSGPTTEDD